MSTQLSLTKSMGCKTKQMEKNIGNRFVEKHVTGVGSSVWFEENERLRIIRMYYVHYETINGVSLSTTSLQIIYVEGRLPQLGSWDHLFGKHFFSSPVL